MCGPNESNAKNENKRAQELLEHQRIGAPNNTSL